jgi:uncharacterized membrane protein (UPF0127 family)
MEYAIVSDGRARWRAAVPHTRAERARGLLGRNRLATDEALMLRGTRSIHTFGMRFTISAAWLDARGRVIAVRRVPPGRLPWPRVRAAAVLEFAEGCAPEEGAVLRIDGPV